MIACAFRYTRGFFLAAGASLQDTKAFRDGAAAVVTHKSITFFSPIKLFSYENHG